MQKELKDLKKFYDDLLGLQEMDKILFFIKIREYKSILTSIKFKREDLNINTWVLEAEQISSTEDLKNAVKQLYIHLKYK